MKLPNCDIDYTLRVYKREEVLEGVEMVYVTSPEVPGLHILRLTAEDALALAPQLIARLRRDNKSS